ncbi:hypothetical protein [Marinobacter zhejiangensis]|uniref:Uncharacterized protein n=1 Tax=Marinobacter zhejiangensis TaxID=488535 RepID=A0A1I4N7D4_9GAMM|nr:hypothetical protein [Marinobacter zhejiangensis]SFM11472.1 hypothetical protein SAMN04487963_1181 [Marinobacter zhejiangensis]
MIIRIFVALLALNMVAFVVRAEAGERNTFDYEISPDTVYELQEEMSGDFERDEGDTLTEIGSRLLSWSFTRGDEGKKYASESVRPDHGVALLERGACLNFKWDF